MNIKERAYQIASVNMKNKCSPAELEDFAEALAAELANENKPVYAFRRKGLDDFCTCDKQRFHELSQKPALFEVQVFYRSPPTAEQIANETAEACAKFVSSRSEVGDYSLYAINIRSGAWKEFKK